MTKASRKKSPRRQVSGERMIALALVEVIEGHQAVISGTEGASSKFQSALDNAKKVLSDHGYEGLESISSRVSKLETEIAAAVKARDGKEIARLGAELNRAERGLPPITKAKAEKKAPKDNALAVGQ